MRAGLALIPLLALAACKADDTEDTVDPKWTDNDGDGYYMADDCDDDDPDVHPFATEVCDGKDNDCNGEVDDAAADAPDWWQDVDGDGYGDPGYVSVTDCDQPDGYVDNDGDCDDTDPDINPELEWYADTDGDGYGDPDAMVNSCEQPTGYVEDATDCDDAYSNAHPGATEYCDGYDNDCDGTADEDDARNAPDWYPDADDDGFGDPGGTYVTQCDQPSGYVDDDTDCDDTDGDVYPGSHATEVPGDGVDTDCDGRDFCTDLDCDGYPDVVFASWTDGSSWEVDSTAWMYADAWADFTALGTTAARLVTSRDLDADGYPDLLFAGYQDPDTETVPAGLFLNGSSGLPATADQEIDLANVRDQCLSDIDGDGNLDVLFTNHVSSGSYLVSSEIWYGDGSGFSTSEELESTGAWGCAVQDLDGDGYVEVVLANYFDGSSYRIDSYVYTGSASGFSTEERTGLPTMGATAVLAEDLDADSFTDLVFAALNDGGNYEPDSVVYWGTSDGYSEGDRTDLATSGAMDVEAADLDGDGFDDLVFPGYRDRTGSYEAAALIYWGSRSGYDTADKSDLDVLGAVDVLVEDLDGDGFDDLVFANSRDDTGPDVDSYVYWGGAGGYSESDRTELPTTGAAGVEAVDLDEDGNLDLVFACQQASATGYSTESLIYWGDGSDFSTADMDELATVGATAVLVVGD